MKVQQIMTRQKKNDREKTKSVVIIGDSMIKHTNRWEISKNLKSKCKVYVKSFPGAQPNV